MHVPLQHVGVVTGYLMWSFTLGLRALDSSNAMSNAALCRTTGRQEVGGAGGGTWGELTMSF